MFIDTECRQLDDVVSTIRELALVKGLTPIRAVPRLRSGARGRCITTVASTPGVETYENSGSPYGPRYIEYIGFKLDDLSEVTVRKMYILFLLLSSFRNKSWKNSCRHWQQS